MDVAGDQLSGQRPARQRWNVGGGGGQEEEERIVDDTQTHHLHL